MNWPALTKTERDDLLVELRHKFLRAYAEYTASKRQYDDLREHQLTEMVRNKGIRVGQRVTVVDDSGRGGEEYFYEGIVSSSYATDGPAVRLHDITKKGKPYKWGGYWEPEVIGRMCPAVIGRMITDNNKKGQS